MSQNIFHRKETTNKIRQEKIQHYTIEPEFVVCYEVLRREDLKVKGYRSYQKLCNRRNYKGLT